MVVDDEQEEDAVMEEDNEEYEAEDVCAVEDLSLLEAFKAGIDLDADGPPPGFIDDYWFAEPDDDEEDPSLSDEEKQDYADAMDATEEHRKNKNRPPKIISAEAVGELPAYFNHETFLFYPDDQVLTDSDDNEIPDPETYIGDALTKYDFDMNDEKVIFVLNYATTVTFTA